MDKKPESVFSNKMKAGARRTYFFDVRKTKGDDFYISISESIRKFNGEGYEKHMVFLYKEDFNRFLECLQQTIDEVKQNLMPDYDYDTFAHRDESPEQIEGTNLDVESEPKEEDNNLSW